MTSRTWSRLGAGVLAGALVALTNVPAASAARDLPEHAALVPLAAVVEQLGFQPYNQGCAVSGGGATGIGNQVGLNSLQGFGSGGFAGPYYAPSFGGYGIGTIGGFLNFTGGFPICTSPFSSVQYSSAPFVLSSLGSGLSAGSFGLVPAPSWNAWGGGAWGSPWGAYPWGGYGTNIGIYVR